MTKLSISTGDASIAGEVTMLLFNARTVGHIMHLNTRNFAQHTALDDFYKGIVDLADRFAEASIGYFKTLVWPADKTVGLSTEAEPANYLSALRASLAEVSNVLTQEDLKNILAEAIELISGTIYKLEQLS